MLSQCTRSPTNLQCDQLSFEQIKLQMSFKTFDQFLLWVSCDSTDYFESCYKMRYKHAYEPI